VSGPTQMYCSEKCCRRAKTARGYDRRKDIPAKCIICGASFMTSKSTRAKTCGPDCAAVYRTRQVQARSDRMESGERPPSWWAYDMPCPWEHALFDTPPAYGTSWYDASADPMTSGAWCDAVEMRERRCAA
jgi:hypothetical protein